jgi:hypothetical protein
MRARLHGRAASAQFNSVASALAPPRGRRTWKLIMTNRLKLSLISGAALLALSLATPASAAPSGSYQQSCRNIEQNYGRTLSADCRMRDGSWNETRLDTSNCDGDIANSNGRLVCNEDDDNDRRADRRDRYSDNDGYAYNQPYDRTYGDRRDNDRWDGAVLSRSQMVRRMERQGYSSARDLRRIGRSNDWRATAWYHGRRVTVRLNPRTGRVLSARFI